MPRLPLPSRRLAAILAPATVLAGAVAVQHTTAAAFKGTATNAGSSIRAGTVILANEATAGGAVTIGSMVPGTTGNGCIKVTYTGTLAASVKVYSLAPVGPLAPWLDLAIDQGTGGSYAGGCTGFSGTNLFSGSATDLATSRNSYATGLGTFAPTGSGQTAVYRITYTLRASAPTDIAGANTALVFQWEGRST